MNRQANVQSIDALRRFQGALRQYAEAIDDVLAMLSTESQRTLDWVQQDQMAYWPAQVREASDQLAEAYTALEMKQVTIDGRDRPAATEERQRVRKAKERLRYCEQKVGRVRQLSGQVQHLADEYRGVLGKLSQLSETDLPRAIVALERMATSLEKYAALRNSDPKSIGTIRSSAEATDANAGGVSSPTSMDLPSSGRVDSRKGPA